MEKEIDLNSEVFLVVREYDANRDLEGKIMEIVQINGDVNTSEELALAATAMNSRLSQKYPLSKYAIDEHYTNDITCFALHNKDIINYLAKNCVLPNFNASTLVEEGKKIS